MVARKPKDESKSPVERRPATTPEARENQLVSLAVDLAEKQLIAGTASAQVISHYLKLGSTREKLEQERMRQEFELTQAKIDQIASQKKIEELYSKALDSMRMYSGEKPAQGDFDVEV